MLAAAFIAITNTEIWVFDLDDGRSVGLKVVLSATTAVASGALAVRRTRPLESFLANSAGVIAAIAVGYPSDYYQWTNLVATYSIAAYGSGRRRWVGLPVSVGGVISYFVRFPDEGSLPIAGLVVAIWVVAWLSGRMHGARIDEIQLRHERDLSNRLAATNEERLALEEERNRIARELHDIIGHTVNVMVVHAGAGRREIERDTGAAAQAFDTIAATGRLALTELDRVLGLLRRDEAGVELPRGRGLADLDELAATLTKTGLQVDLRVRGEVDSVPASVALATYRIIQEALTNTMRHTEATRADVEVKIGEGVLKLRVADDGRGDPERVQAGRGLVGMQERVALHGGTLRIDRDDEGLVVLAELGWSGAP